jgi:hypothetical protein
MSIVHEMYDHNSFQFISILVYSSHQAVGRLGPPPAPRGSPHEAKEMRMRAPGQTSVWRTPIGIGRAREAKGWYQQLRDWWAARHAARRDAHLPRSAPAGMPSEKPSGSSTLTPRQTWWRQRTCAQPPRRCAPSSFRDEGGYPVCATGNTPRSIRADAGPLTPAADVSPHARPYFPHGCCCASRVARPSPPTTTLPRATSHRRNADARAFEDPLDKQRRGGTIFRISRSEAYC